MPESMILLQKNNHIARITLNRPDVKNGLTCGWLRNWMKSAVK